MHSLCPPLFSPPRQVVIQHHVVVLVRFNVEARGVVSGFRFRVDVDYLSVARVFE